MKSKIPLLWIEEIFTNNNNNMNTSKKHILILLGLLLLSVFWVNGMTASSPAELKFYLIFIPVVVLIGLEYILILTLAKSKRSSIPLKWGLSAIIPIGLLAFLFFSFGESKNKICVSGDCENGYGEAIYIKSERTTKSANSSNYGELEYYEPEFFGRNWFNNIVWYDGNPITHVYRGEFKDGCFDGVGQEIYFTYNYPEEHMFEEEYKFIDGVYFVEGEWEKGWLFWDEESIRQGYVKMNPEIKKMLDDLGLDKKGYTQRE